MKNSPTVQILFEDENLLVLDKSPYVVVNRAESVSGQTLQDWFENQYSEIIKEYRSKELTEEIKVFLDRSGMVHRLDKDTSGIILWAKNPETMFQLMDKFKNRDVQKTYIALVHGQFKNSQGYIRVPLGRTKKNRHKFGVQIEGKMSETKYQVLESYTGDQRMYSDGFSLVELWPKTGRTHQIRVVLKHLQKPIVGDSLYVGRKRAKYDSSWAQRQFLHAKAIEFEHPVTGKFMIFESALPQDLTDMILYLQNNFEKVV